MPEKALKDAVAKEVMLRSRDSGDVSENVGALVGNVPRSKVGDVVVTLGPDSAAAGARIVVEAKEAAGYSLKSTLEEIGEARKNRVAQVGLFIHSRSTAPAEMRPLVRYGDDVLVVWDAEDAASDAYLDAGLAVARALCVRAVTKNAERSADLQEMTKAIHGIEQQVEKLADIRTKTNAIRSAADFIGESTETMERDLRRRIQVLLDTAASLTASS